VIDGRRVTALVQGPDRPGIIAGITNFIAADGGNIIYLDQHTDPVEGMFFMRVQFDLAEGAGDLEETAERFAGVCHGLGMNVRLRFSDRRPRVALMVSRHGHCLSDLLYRWKSGHLLVDIPCVIGNHDDQRSLVEYYGIPFHHLPVTDDTRAAREQQVLDLFRHEAVDTVILARYMQILSPVFVAAYPNAIINIHHSFLPAFVGADPYRQAFSRGVKIIGATSHYVTEQLDQGPIIAQDVVSVSHRDTVDDLRRKGQDMEKLVLARAVALHAGDRVLVHEGKTVVFGD
jgi:formyltetrahydrofolate deformylase